MSRVYWNENVVAALREYQESGIMHPYTCGNDSQHRDLVPTSEGWKCLDCDYTQDWFHAASADPVYIQRMKEAIADGPNSTPNTNGQ